MASVIFRMGTKAQYDALPQKEPTALYWLTDAQEIRKGDDLYGKGANATQQASGLLSAEDKAYLDQIVASGIMNLEAVDNSIVIGSGTGKKTIRVQISSNPYNALSMEEDGLFVPIDPVAVVPEYSIEKMETATEGYSATYRMKKIVDGSELYVGDAINIPKDLVVKKGSVKTVTVEDEPYEGAKIGDTYIDLELNDEEKSHIYIPTKGIIDVSNKVDSLIEVGDGSNSFVSNKADGGCIKFEHKDGTEVFVGVRNGGINGLMAQIYADKMVNGKMVGSRINVYNDRIYYTSMQSVLDGKEMNSADCEIATIGYVDDSIGESLAWKDM